MREEADHAIMQRDKKAAEDASEQKSRFLSHMSHEIRTPLNAMLGMNELIMHETDYEQIRKYSTNLQSAGRTLLALINDVLDFSKIETGKMDIVESDYSLSSTLNDVVLMTQTRATDKGLEYRLDIDSSLPDVLRGDEVRIKQIVVNIMTNAIKYTKEGYIELAVYPSNKSEYLDEDNLNLVIRVTDTGIGIKQEDMKKLFTEFERFDRNKNNNIEGTGLGLSITSRLVELMHGEIDVKSEYGKGSIFTVTIPQYIVSNVPIGDYKKRFDILTNENEKREKQSLENMKFTGKRVYVVDDNEMNLEVIASILELLEIHVDKAGGGKEAMEHLDHNSYDLILTDDMMPEVGGTELMQYLHNNKESASNKTPIVVLTANAVAGAREEYINNGFDDYLTKPIDIDVLQKILVTYLK
jgi:CheY-like chemotaxis protein